MSKGMLERAAEAIKKQKKKKKDRLDEIMSNGPVPDERDDGKRKSSNKEKYE